MKGQEIRGATVQEEVAEIVRQKPHEANSIVDQLGSLHANTLTDLGTQVWSMYPHLNREDISQLAHGSLSNTDAHMFREDLSILVNPDTNF